MLHHSTVNAINRKLSWYHGKGPGLIKFAVGKYIYYAHPVGKEFVLSRLSKDAVISGVVNPYDVAIIVDYQVNHCLI